MKHMGGKYIAIRFIATFVTIYLLSKVISSVEIKTIFGLVAFVLLLTLIGLLLRPIMMVLGLPFSILTFGLFIIVMEAWLIMLTDALLPSIHIGGFVNAFLISLIIGIIRSVSKMKMKDNMRQLHSK